MKFWISVFLTTSVLLADPPLTLFKIDPALRGPEISSIVTTFTDPLGTYYTSLSEVAVQTSSGFITSPIFARFVQGGFIPYVQSAVSSPNGTLLTITYLPSGASTQNQYIIVPIEMMATVMYSPRAISPPGPVSFYPKGELPRYDMDPALRAADLVSVFTDFTTNPDFKDNFKAGQNSIGIFTTLAGPFNPPITNGFIPFVQSITATGAYLTITYLPFSQNGRTYNKTTAVIIVTAEQVRQMVYYPNKLYSSSGL